MEKIIKILLFCYLVVFPFGVLARVPVRLENFPEVNFYLADILVGGIGLVGLIGPIGKKKYKLPNLAKPMIVFLGITLLSLLLNIPSFEKKEIFVAGLYWLRLLAYFGLYLMANWVNWTNLQDCLLVVGGAVAVFGFVQYFFFPDLRPWEKFGWDPHFLRLAGTFLDPNFTGIILVLSLILVFSYSKLKTYQYLLITIYYISLFLTYSRASFLALLIGAGVYFLREKRTKIFLGLIFVIFITIIILPKNLPSEGVKLGRIVSAEARLGSWRQALIIAKDHPLFGVGFNAYRYAQRKYGFLKEDWQTSHSGAGADNSFLFILATSGSLGLLGFFGFLGKVLKISFKKSPLIFASTIAILVHSSFNNTLFYPWVLGWWMIILGTM